MLGLVHEGEGVAARALESFGIGHEAVRQRVEETIGPVEAFGGAAVGLLEGLGINPKSARPVGVAQPGGDDANVSPVPTALVAERCTNRGSGTGQRP